MDLLAPDGTLTCVCFRLRRSARVATRIYEHHLRPVDLQATQYTVLAMLNHVPEIGLTKLAELLNIDRTGLTKNLAVLTRRGLIAVAQGGDRRQRRVSITPRGRQVANAALPLWRAAQAEVNRSLTTEEGALLLHLLKRIDAIPAPDSEQSNP